MPEPLRVALLGPLEVHAGARAVALGGRRSRMLVAVLALHANAPVRRDALIDAIWGDAPPGSAAHALENLVSRARVQLGPDVLQLRSGGYALALAPEHVDAARFEALADQGREALARGDPGRAAAVVREALGLWRGEPLADLGDERALADEIRRLNDARAVAIEDRVDADLALGRHAELVPELRSLVAAEPLRERRRAQLMLALYRSGQHTEALRVYREAQAYLAGELGLQPGRELRELELAVMRHDADLAPPRATPPERRPSKRGRWIPAAAGLLGVAAVVGVAALVALGGPDRVAFRGNGVLLVGGEGVRSVATDVGLSGLAALGRAVWASSYASGRLVRVDPAAGAVTQSVTVGQGPGSTAAAGGDLWVVDAVGGRIVRMDGATGKVVQRIGVGESPVAVVAGFGSVWAASAGEQSVTRLDPKTGRPMARIEVGAVPAALSAGAGGVWVAQPDARQLVRIEPRREVIDATVPVGGGARAVAASGDAVWVANTLDANVSRVDPSLGRVIATTPVDGAPIALAADDDGAWVAIRGDEVLLRLAGLDARVVRRVRVGGRPVALERLGDRVAVAVAPKPTEHRGGTLRVRGGGSGSVVSLDPGACCAASGPEPLSILYDGLTAFDRFSSSTPSVVADLAVALPNPTAGGRVYTFRLRPGLRYSTGAPVRASDFRRAAERSVDSHNEGTRAFEALAHNRKTCRPEGPCDLRDSILADDVAGTVSFHLARPDPDFLYKLTSHVTAPVPEGTPVEIGTDALPGTGPYRVQRFTPREIVLERNRFFREWSPSAQPAGRPDRIVFRSGEPAEDSAAAVLDGAADVMIVTPPRATLARLRIEHPGQLHLHDVPGGFQAFLGTRSPPFDDVRVRRALNLAVDRNAAVDAFGGPGTAAPTCQLLPPGVSGYVRYCPYTRDPTASGRWNGPDLERARRLVAGTRHRGMLVTYWVFNLPEDVQLARLTLRALQQLGYRTRLRYIHGPPTLPGTAYQIVGQGGPLDYPAASPYLSPWLNHCRGWHPRKPGDIPILGAFCDRRLVEFVAKAVRVQTVAPDQARRWWAAADRRMVDEAAFVPFVSTAAVDVTGPQVGNYAWSPAVGVLLDQMWVH